MSEREKGGVKYMSSKKNTYTVCFREKNLSLEVEEGTTLLQAEIAAGMVR